MKTCTILMRLAMSDIREAAFKQSESMGLLFFPERTLIEEYRKIDVL